MALTFVDIRTEVLARGFDYLGDTAGLVRLKRWVNEAMHDVDDMERWPYREASASGAAPLTISDLGIIETVRDTTSGAVLQFQAREAVVSEYVDPATTGIPAVYYVSAGTVVNVYPARASGSVTVQYFKVGVDLSADADAPLMPDRFRNAVVEYTVAKALRDKSNFQEAQLASQAGDAVVERMREWYALLPGGHEVQLMTGASSDG